MIALLLLLFSMVPLIPIIVTVVVVLLLTGHIIVHGSCQLGYRSRTGGSRTTTVAAHGTPKFIAFSLVRRVVAIVITHVALQIL